MNRTSRVTRLATVALTVCTVVAGTIQADEPTSSPRFREIQSRQRGDVLRVYVNQRGPYVNGRAIAATHLPALVRAVGLESAVITGDAAVDEATLSKVEALVREGGAKAVESRTTDRPVGEQEAKLRKILARQRGDVLRVYVSDRGTYVNGTQLKTGELTTIATRAELQRGEISAEPHVAVERVDGTADILRAAGVKEVARTTPKFIAKEPEATVREVLGRQRGHQLGIYLRSSSAFVNGRSVSLDVLGRIVRESGLDEVVLSVERSVTKERVAEVEKLVRAAGVEKVTRKSPKKG